MHYCWHFDWTTVLKIIHTLTTTERVFPKKDIYIHLLICRYSSRRYKGSYISVHYEHSCCKHSEDQNQNRKAVSLILASWKAIYGRVYPFSVYDRANLQIVRNADRPVEHQHDSSLLYIMMLYCFTDFRLPETTIDYTKNIYFTWKIKTEIQKIFVNCCNFVTLNLLLFYGKINMALKERNNATAINPSEAMLKVPIDCHGF